MVEPVGVIKSIVELAGFVIAVDETSYGFSHDPCPMRFLCSQHAFLCFLVGLHHCCFLVVRHSADKGTLAFAGKNHFGLFSDQEVMTMGSFCDKERQRRKNLSQQWVSALKS